MKVTDDNTTKMELKRNRHPVPVEPGGDGDVLVSELLTKRRPATGRIATVLVLLIVLVATALTQLRWQQSVVGNGEVIVYDAMSRPQPVEAQISGRLIKWDVQEGQVVKAGQVLGELQDIDSKFLDPKQIERLNSQVASLELGRQAAMNRSSMLNQQQSELEAGRQAAISAARQRRSQAQKRFDASTKGVVSAEQNLKIARDVARKSAMQRANQAEDRVIQARQSAQAADKNLQIAKLQLERIKNLNSQGLVSDRDKEISENEYVRAQTSLQSANAQLAIAEKDVKVGNLEQDRASLEIIRAQAALDQARASQEVAERDIANADLDIERITRDTMAQVNAVGASIESAQETINKNSADIQKAQVEAQNVTQRSGQQIIVAPVSGQVTALNKVGTGTTVKAGDRLAIITPLTQDRAVEVFVSDNDVPLLKVGDKVRIQFAGWPAVQFSGWQEYIPSYGTFGGKVAVIDALDDGTSRFRVIVQPDIQTLPNGKTDMSWPDAGKLRPGTQAVGWVMLGQVSLGWEIWRQFNGFPANYRGGDRLGQHPSKDPGYGGGKKMKKDYADQGPDTVKLKAK